MGELNPTYGRPPKKEDADADEYVLAWYSIPNKFCKAKWYEVAECPRITPLWKPLSEPPKEV
mgnify:FL=1|jgi:hypothetical protein